MEENMVQPEGKLRIRHRKTGRGFGIDSRKISTFIDTNITHRKCSKYATTKGGSGLCKCGRDEDWHNEENLQPCYNADWSPDTSTKSIQASTFGEINFSGFGHESSVRSPYVRVDYKTPPHIVWQLMDEYWHLPPPKLLISVTGGAKKFFMKNRLLNIFKRGLINAATTTGAWIITGGTNTGVMKFVGEAVRDHLLSTGMVDKNKVVALGIATWGIIENRESLVGEPGVGCFPAHYNAEELTISRNAPIDHNHSHFIFVDNGTEQKFGVEIDFRVMLENFISTKLETEVSANKSVYIPVVLLVVEGGIGSLKTAAECVDKNIPIVVIQGSGRAADYIAMAFKETKPKDPNDEVPQYGADFDERQASRALKLFEWATNMTVERRNEEATKSVMQLKKCLAKRRMVTVFHLEDDKTNDMEKAILSALLKANKTNAQSQLDLAMALDRCDIARTEIFKYDNLESWKKIDLYEAMFMALAQNRVDFVQLFLDNGVEVKKFLTISRLHRLYKQILDDPAADSAIDYMKSYIDDVEFETTITCRRPSRDYNVSDLLYVVGKCLSKLLGDHYPNNYLDEKYLVEVGHAAAKNTPRCEVVSETPGGAGITDSLQLVPKGCSLKQVRPVGDFEHPERELLLWAVLFNRYELAEMFWKSGSDHIGAALAASALFRSLSKGASSDEVIDLSQEYIDNASNFEQLATGVLNECYQKDKGLTQRLLIRELETFGNTTVMAVADNAHRMEFMQHASCQFKLNTVWKGNMALYTSYWKVIMAMFIPLFVPLIKYVHTSKVANYWEGSDTVDGEEEEAETVFMQDPVLEQETNTYKVKSLQKSKSVKGKLRVHHGRRMKKLRDVAWSGKSVNKIGLFDAMHYFYTAPITKFMFNIVSYLIFLGLFSYFLLIELCPMYVDDDICRYGTPPGHPSVVEYITWGWCITLMMEEVRQVFVRDPRRLRYKIKDWFHDVWNKFDLLVYTTFILAIILRLTLPPETFIWARIMYCGTLAMCFLRFLHMFFVNKNIGPKVIMIRRMVTDLMFFVVILIVFILGYGLVQQALLYPNTEPSWNILRQVVEQPYWSIYGELFFDTFEGSMTDCTTNRSIHRLTGEKLCPEKVWIVPVVMALYILLTNVLLINLLIAMFSYTFQKVQDNSEKVWRFYRYSLISEYLDRPALAPPLIIFNHLYRVIVYCVNRCRSNVDRSTHLKKTLGEDETRMLRAFEKEGMERYLILKVRESKEHTHSRVVSAGERIEKVIEDLEEIKEQVIEARSPDILTASVENLKDSLDGQSSASEAENLKEQLSHLERKFQVQMENQQKQFQMLLNVIQQQQGVDT